MVTRAQSPCYRSGRTWRKNRRAIEKHVRCIRYHDEPCAWNRLCDGLDDLGRSNVICGLVRRRVQPLARRPRAAISGLSRQIHAVDLPFAFFKQLALILFDFAGNSGLRVSFSVSLVPASRRPSELSVQLKAAASN
jgi:hypothetical protein